MLVVIKPSTGEILAVAQNAAADADGPSGHHRSVPAGLDVQDHHGRGGHGRDMATPNTLLGCPGEMEIGDRVVPNYNRFDLGVVPMARAFANSCNTTFAELASRMPPTALTVAASQYGIGADYVIEGLTTVTGTVPPTVDGRAHRGRVRSGKAGHAVRHGADRGDGGRRRDPDAPPDRRARPSRPVNTRRPTRPPSRGCAR